MAKAKTKTPRSASANLTDRELCPGDVVELKSGGAPMTVEAIDGTNVRCVWCPAHSSHVKRDAFPQTVLQRSRFTKARRASITY